MYWLPPWEMRVSLFLLCFPFSPLPCSPHQHINTFCCIKSRCLQCYSQANLFFFNFIYLFLENREGKEKERERNINVWLPLTGPPLGTWPTTQACALTGSRSSDLHSIHWATPARAGQANLVDRQAKQSSQPQVLSCTISAFSYVKKQCHVFFICLFAHKPIRFFPTHFNTLPSIHPQGLPNIHTCQELSQNLPLCSRLGDCSLGLPTAANRGVPSLLFFCVIKM